MKFASFLLSWVLLIGAGSLSVASAFEKPNFVWLISEDNSKHYLKLFDEAGVDTPNIATLADHGLVFNHAFSNSPVCSVARTTLMTSCYAPRIGAQYHRRSQLVPLPRGVEMFPALLREAGYYTSNNSKKDYNTVESQNVWNESSRKATWRKRNQQQPFFHMQTFTQSHEGSLHFDQQKFESFVPETDIESAFVAPYHPQTELFRYTNAFYRDRIQIIDRKVGEVISQLKADGELENTFVFYFGDHGGVLPRSKGYAYESGLHVPLVVRVPENFKHLVNFDIQSNPRVDGFVSFVDFGPTLLKLAGIESGNVDGQPFLGGSIDISDLNSRDTTLGYADRFDEKSDLVRSLRKGKFKYIRNYEPFNFDGMQNNYRYQMLAYREWKAEYEKGQLNPIQSQFFEAKSPEALYDLEADPHEVRNLAADPALAKKLAEMRTQLSNQLKSMPDLSFFPESYLLENAFQNPTKFGQTKRTQIAELIDIADLACQRFEDVAEALQRALESKDPWKRYWGAVVCSSFGNQAKPHLKLLESMAARDPEILVRVRAAEFLGITHTGDPAEVIGNALQESRSRVEMALILNSVVMLRDGYDCRFDIQRDWFEKGDRRDNVERRLLYLLAK